MKEIKMKCFSYRCSCGFKAEVFIDFGIPQEFYKCRKCGENMKRSEV